MAQPADEPPLPIDYGREFYFPEISDEEWNDWKWQFKNRIKTIDKLHTLLNIPEPDLSRLRELEKTTDLHIAVPPYYLAQIRKNHVPYDPIYLQAVPNSLEYDVESGHYDPLAEDHTMPVEGLVHRYPDRVLFLATNMCPMYCRHCTRRREWEDGELPRHKRKLDAMIDYIRQHTEVRDIVISGGDPLSLPEPLLEHILKNLRAIPHVEIIRVGTRFPVVMPQRITDKLAGLLSQYGPIWVNTHFNHDNEITPDAKAACQRLLRAGIPVNNQSVLLKGVNDTVEDMSTLCKRLLTIGVRPYYLYLNDEPQGTRHFTTSIKTGIDIIKGMRGFISGLAIPTFVVDAPGGGGKIPIGPDYVKEMTDDHIVVMNYEGKIYRYSTAD